MAYGNGIGSVGMGSPTVDCAARQLEVHGAIEQAGYAANTAGEMVVQLADRLASAGVLRPAPPTNLSGGLKNEGYGCDLANRISSVADRTRASTSALQDLLDRLEV